MARHEKAAAVGVEERLLVAELLLPRLVLPLNKLPSAGIGRQRDTVHMVMHVSTKRVTQIKSEVQEVVHPRLRRGEGGWGRGSARGGR